ncbi:MAG: efflux RND transporter periplasmic adaptor subunit [Colwellia sp.]
MNNTSDNIQNKSQIQKQSDTHTNMTPNIKRRKTILAIVIVLLTFFLVSTIFKNPPKSVRSGPSKAPQMTVSTTLLTPQSYQVVIESFGTVKPRTQSGLFAQVSGQINRVNQAFREGGFFEQGDVLIELDSRDHQAEVNIAKASLMSAKQSLEEEKARVKQAKADWARLGNGQSASALVLRQPQLESARAQTLSAQAQLDKAQLSLERTKIIAPYAGRILKKHVDIGQVISSNTQLADIFAVDYVEIRLPIKNKDLSLMTLPETYQNDDKDTEFSNVLIKSDLMGEQQWRGKVVRTESAIDEMSQQLYVVAQIIRPYDKEYNQGAQIKIGQYVTAYITGKKVDNVLVIPSSAIYQGTYVYTVKDNLLIRKDIKVGWQNGEESIVVSGLSAGEQLVLTSLGQVSSGTPVTINNGNDQAPLNKKNTRSNKEGRGE